MKTTPTRGDDRNNYIAIDVEHARRLLTTFRRMNLCMNTRRTLVTDDKNENFRLFRGHGVNDKNVI